MNFIPDPVEFIIPDPQCDMLSSSNPRFFLVQTNNPRCSIFFKSEIREENATKKLALLNFNRILLNSMKITGTPTENPPGTQLKSVQSDFAGNEVENSFLCSF